ncbi:MAG TPA: glucosyl-3-phosphoglycerate synthase [Acidimicrobiales bacterium]|nr:glucosyl-3-phosphoglycerate synthase [Acidimicrobiales bacterium]
MPGPASPPSAFARQQFSATDLVQARGARRVSVCLPARDEEATIGAIVAALVDELQERHPLLHEVIVVDDGSGDGTAARGRSAGARVVCSPRRGKGAAMQQGLRASSGDIVVFCDADVHDFDTAFVLGLVGPLLIHDGIGFVKGFYDRPYQGRHGQGGRVTELVAKPLLRTLFPDLSWLCQPLAGECAGRRDVLTHVPFVCGYGVDIALLIDIAQRFGCESLAQVDLGRRVHRNRPLEELAPQAEEVLRTVLARAGVAEAVPEAAPLSEQA